MRTTKDPKQSIWIIGQKRLKRWSSLLFAEMWEMRSTAMFGDVVKSDVIAVLAAWLAVHAYTVDSSTWKETLSHGTHLPPLASTHILHVFFSLSSLQRGQATPTFSMKIEKLSIWSWSIGNVTSFSNGRTELSYAEIRYARALKSLRNGRRRRCCRAR